MKAELSLERKACTYAYRLLKVRNRSEREIRDRLSRKGYPAEVVDKVIAYLGQLGLVDDKRFAQEWVNFRLKVPFGLKRIFLELRHKGIAEDIINEVLDKVRKCRAESQVLNELVRKKLCSLRKHERDKIKIKQRLYAFLLRRGFSSGDIIELIDELGI
jgi:regulatory protein